MYFRTMGHGGHGPWGPWAMGAMGLGGHGPWGPWAMGAMGHGGHGPWGPWAMGAMGHGPWVLRLYFQPLASGCISGRWPPVVPILFSSGSIFSFPVYVFFGLNKFNATRGSPMTRG